jgi:molecular chaperone DnaK
MPLASMSKVTSKEQSIRIQANGGLSDADIDKMVKDAEAHAAEDKRRKEVVEAKNGADAAIHQTEKALSEHGDKIGAADKGAIEQALADLKAANEGEDVEAIRAKTQSLVQASMKLGEAMYQAQAGAAGQAPGGEAAHGAAGGSNEGVVDAEFEEVGDDDQAKRA